MRFVRMIRQGDVEPRTADVHPAEIDNYRIGGWEIAEDQPENQTEEQTKEVSSTQKKRR